MRPVFRLLAPLTALALLLALVPGVLAAGPTREVIDLNDPQTDIDESAWATEWCGFPVVAEVAGHWTLFTFPEGRHMFQKDSYHTRARYTNPANGLSAQVRDIGPDRFFEKDGRLYVAVTGRSMLGLGTIGNVVIDLETNEIVHQAGREPGLFNDTFCSLID